MAGAGAAAVLGRTSLTLKNKYIRIRKGKMFGKGMSLGGGGGGVYAQASVGKTGFAPRIKDKDNKIQQHGSFYIFVQ
jgi:hypothetical protein